MSNSYTPPDRSTYDPGWNDPPPMSGQPVSHTIKSRPNLNKRVAFPMQTTASSNTTVVKTADSGLPLPFSTAKYNPNATPAAPQGMPPPLSSTSIAPPPITTVRPPACASTQIDQSAVNQCESIDIPSNAREFCRNIFEKIVKESPEPHDTIQIGEIERRLDILYKMWATEQISKEIEKRLYFIAKDLDEKNIPSAMDNHRLLVLNETATTIQWGTALRHLILLNEPNDSGPIAAQERNDAWDATANTAPIPSLLNINAISQNLSNCNLSTNTNKKPGASRFGQIQHL